MNKRLRNILVSATLLGSVSFVSNPAFAATKVNNYSELTKAIVAGTTSDIQLESNVSDFSKNIKLNTAGTVVNIDGQGNTIGPKNGSRLLGFDVQNGNSLSVKNAVLDGFKNVGWGSAIFNDGDLTLENVTFNGNQALQGFVDGAVANYAQNDAANAQLLGAMKFTNNSAAAYGGAIYNNGQMIIDSQDKQAVFQGNNSNKWAGAIFNKADLAMKGDIIFGSGTDTSLKNNADNRGGAIFNEGTIISDAKLTFGNNTARWEGGAIKNVGDLILENTSGNVTSFVKNSSIQGGAIVNEGTITSDQNLIFKGNIAQGSSYNSYGYSYGGAIFNSSTGEITLKGSDTFEKNSSVLGSGGAIYNAGTMTIANSGSDITRFIANTAKVTGGAIFNAPNGSLFLNGNFDFSNNNADGYGGAIHNRGLMNLEGKFTFEGNTAGQSGGALYNEAGDLIINGIRDNGSGSIVFKNNKLTSGASDGVRGGAVYIKGDSNKYAYLDINGTDFIDNTSNSHGGAIYVDQYVKFNIENSLFSGNKVGENLNQLGWGRSNWS